MADTQLNERDTKLTQWLNEAHVKEAELEADLTAHIGLTTKASYKKRLQQHLRETRDHKRKVAARIKKLGGQASSPAVRGVPGPAGTLAGKAVAAVKGQVGAARAMVTEQAETHLRNAQEELREEHVEIALYDRIETLANEVGDRDTAQLAKSIRRDEERMAKFLTAELGRLVKALVRAEIPRDQRATSGRSRRRSGRTTPRSRTSAARRTTAGTRRSASTRAGGTRSTAARSTSGRGGSTRSASGTRRSSAASRSSGRSGSSSRSGGSSSRSGASSSRSRSSTSRAGGTSGGSRSSSGTPRGSSSARGTNRRRASSS